MSITSKLPWLLCIALVLLVCWIFYKMIDQSVSLDHQTQHANTISKQRNLLVHVVNALASNEQENKVKEVIKEFSGDEVFQKGNGEVVADQVSFIFKDGRLLRVDVGDDKEEKGDDLK